MKRLILGLFLSLVLVSLITVPALAAKGDNPANDNPNNLYLYEKDAAWAIIWGGAWGKMSWNTAGDFRFNGKGLEPGVSYELIVYVDPWPGAGSTSLGTGTANGGGNVNIAGTLPALTNAKIWLVLDDDFTDKMVGWHPAEYLFEHNLIPTAS